MQDQDQNKALDESMALAK